MSGDGTPAKAPVRSDDEIRNSVLMELKWDPKITSTDIGVAVKDGVVTLAGFVSSYWEKDGRRHYLYWRYSCREHHRSPGSRCPPGDHHLCDPRTVAARCAQEPGPARHSRGTGYRYSPCDRAELAE